MTENLIMVGISLQEVSRRICDSGAGEKFIIPQVLL